MVIYGTGNHWIKFNEAISVGSLLSLRMQYRVLSFNGETEQQPLTLYKYRNWEVANHKTILTKREVFMASPGSFVDPRDCKAHDRFELTQTDVFRLNHEIESKNSRHLSLHERNMRALQWASIPLTNDSNALKPFIDKELNDIDRRVGILSLCRENDKVSMWNLYSNSGRGFCVGFDFKILSQYANVVGLVSYYDILPELFPNVENSDEIYKLYFCKERSWEFEQEYRLMINNAKGLNEHQRTIRLPKECFKEIIFGSNISNGDKQSIINVCKSARMEVTFHQAHLVDGEIKLTSIF